MCARKLGRAAQDWVSSDSLDLFFRGGRELMIRRTLTETYVSERGEGRWLIKSARFRMHIQEVLQIFNTNCEFLGYLSADLHVFHWTRWIFPKVLLCILYFHINPAHITSRSYFYSSSPTLSCPIFDTWKAQASQNPGEKRRTHKRTRPYTSSNSFEVPTPGVQEDSLAIRFSKYVPWPANSRQRCATWRLICCLDTRQRRQTDAPFLLRLLCVVLFLPPRGVAYCAAEEWKPAEEESVEIQIRERYFLEPLSGAIVGLDAEDCDGDA